MQKQKQKQRAKGRKAGAKTKDNKIGAKTNDRAGAKTNENKTGEDGQGVTVTQSGIRALHTEVAADGSFQVLQDALTHVPLRYVKPFGTPVRRAFSVELPELPVQDQGGSGRCWIFAGINVLRRLLLAKYGSLPETFNLSHAHVFFYSWLEKCNSALESALFFHRRGQLSSAMFKCVLEGILSDGGTWAAFTSLVEKYGVVPLEVFSDTRPAHVSGELNDVLKVIMRMAVAELIERTRRSGGGGDGDMATEVSEVSEVFAGVKQRTMKRVFRTLCAMLGTPPASFDYDDIVRCSSSRAAGRGVTGARGPGARYTPASFYAQVVSPVFKPADYVCLTNDPRRPNHDLFGSQFAFTVLEDRVQNDALDSVPSNLFWNVSVADMKAAAQRSIAAGQPLWFSCDVRKYYDDESLVLNASASNIERLTGGDIWTVSKAALYESGAIENSHAMTLVGYDRDLATWKVDNSWGQSNALIMTGKWFDRFVVTVVVPVKHLDSASAGAYRAKMRAGGRPSYLAPPWDIYGSPQRGPDVL